MVVKLYYNIATSPSRAVIYTLEALNVPYELIEIKLPDDEQLTEKFLKINPQHTLPTIQDEDGFIIWESHAINAYLVNKYGKDDKLYPKDPKSRALVDQRLHFHNGVLFVSLLNNIKQIIVNENYTKVTEELKKPVEEAQDFLEIFLKGKKFVAGDNITIADFSITTSLVNLYFFVPLDSKRYPLIENYMKRCEVVIPRFKEVEGAAKERIIEILNTVHFEFNC